ncbi:sphingosine kinase 1-like [Triticum dicoccoides]|uniref:sphingosine kinase 1-like n=1 Tax=Triticum dicoccoides TaxID=85692 RepID=UPI00188DECDA|nr:sphingosine kinase 1-like [Triticum dicoccoides]
MADPQAKARGPPEPRAEALVEPVRFNGSAAEATLSSAELAWRTTGAGRDSGGRRKLELESDVLGFQVEGRALKLVTFTRGDVTGAGRPPSPVGCGGGAEDRKRGEVAVEMESEEAAERWGHAIRDRFASLGRPKRLFFIVNPYGGKRGGRKIFQTEVLPLIEAAGIHYTMQETNYRLHAQEIAGSLDLRKYDGIICVSGDGILVEVVNGLLQRDDWDKAIKVPLGIIPAGTGNGMVQGLLHSAGEPFSMSNAVFAIIRGHRRALDVTSVVQGKTRFFSVMMLTWGLVADIDIESEKFRWMGSARIDFYSLLRAVNLRRYNGRILFVPAPGYEGFGDPVEQTISCKSNGAANAAEGDITDVCNNETCTYSGPSTDDADLEWRSLKGPFVNVWISNIAFASEGVMIAPQAQFADGYLDAAIIKDCPWSVALGLLLRMKDGSYIESPYVEYFKVKALRIEPGLRVGSSTIGGIIDSDGEVLARGDRSQTKEEPEHLMAYGPPIQLTVDQGLATIFSPR